MNDNWYNCNNWYEPEKEQKELVLPAAYYRAEKIRRIFMVIAILLAIAVAVLYAVDINMRQSDDDGLEISLPSGSLYDFDSGNMPKDWHDYMEYIYSGSTASAADISVERVTERGKLNLRIGSGGDTLSYQEIYEKCAPSVVYIKGGSDDSSGYNWGTGIVASADGYILTNTHVIDECDYVEVGTYDGKSYDAKLVGYDSDSDIAVLKIDAKGLTPATFALTDSVSVGDTAIAIGNPLGESYCLTMTDGIVSGLDRSVNYEGRTMRLLQTSTAINEGNSGGPLINDKGQVIGITNMKVISAASGVEGIGFAIPTDTVREVVAAIMDDGAVYGKGTIGITVGAITEDVAEYYDIPNGLYVSEVNEKSDAYAQGMRKGDIIVKVNGKSCTSTNDIAEEKAKCDIGDTLTFRIWRDGKSMTLTVEIMDSQDLN